MRYLSLSLFIVFLAGCSDHGSTWKSAEDLYPGTSTGQIHGDKRTQSQRYQDCLRQARLIKENTGKHGDLKQHKLRCVSRSYQPDPDYMKVIVR
nr:hypothetical protein [Pantoea sp. 201603H]